MPYLARSAPVVKSLYGSMGINIVFSPKFNPMDKELPLPKIIPALETALRDAFERNLK